MANRVDEHFRGERPVIHGVILPEKVVKVIETGDKIMRDVAEKKLRPSEAADRLANRGFDTVRLTEREGRVDFRFEGHVDNIKTD